MKALVPAFALLQSWLGIFKPKSNTFVFIICALIATFFWFLKSLEQTYSTEVSFPIYYENFPENKILKDSLPRKINFEIRASGWDILSIKTGSEIYPVTIDFERVPYDNKIVLDRTSFFLEEKVPGGVNIMDIHPDTLNIEFDQLAEKMVPVSLNGDISYKDHHGLVDSIKLVPSEVHIEGPKTHVEKIHRVQTEKFELKKVSGKTIRTLALKKPQKPFLEYNQSKVKLIVPVEKLTEKTLSIPVQTQNPYFYTRITLIPKEVSLTFQTGLSKYNQITEQDFKSVVNAKVINSKNPPNKLEVKITEKPSFIYNLRINPESVDYLIESEE